MIISEFEYPEKGKYLYSTLCIEQQAQYYKCIWEVNGIKTTVCIVYWYRALSE